MTEPVFQDLFRVYPNRNSELRSLVKKAYEFGATISQEQSSALSTGLGSHAITRMRTYIGRAKITVERLAAKPVPDLPRSHPTQYPIDMSVPYNFFTTDKSGTQIPINEDAQALAEAWMTFCAELALSESAALAGSLFPFDEQRALNNIGVIEQLLNEIEDNAPLDMAETNVTSTGYGPASSATVAK